MRVIGGFAAAATMILVGNAIAPAHAISAQAARACDALVAKAFPPRQKGNPASGSAIGNAKDQRDYFNRCLANGGKIDDDTSTKVKQRAIATRDPNQRCLWRRSASIRHDARAGH